MVQKKMPRWLKQDDLVSDISKNKINLKNILHYSNANPLRCKTSEGFGCGFCPRNIPEAANLKQHFSDVHRNDTLIKHLNSRFFDHVLKLDISYLKCTICNQDMKMLDDLIHHLQDQHEFLMFTDAKSLILPFRFETAELKCSICSTQFPNFKLLQEHMNSHFRNYICDICGAGFVTEKLLSLHIKRHPSGEFKCSQCSAVFDTKEKRHGHIKRIHLGCGRRNKCRVCDERFVDYWKMIGHMVKEHGMEPVVMKCQACDRTFNNQRSLSRHTKKDHLMERRHKCTECDMMFFGKTGLLKHMTKHTGVRSYKCEVCSKAYGRKNTLREHMRIHSNDRRFSCDICGQAFVQKCSWKGHMRSKHGV